MTGILIRTGEWQDTVITRMPCDVRSRDHSYVSTSQGDTKDCWPPSGAREDQGRLFASRFRKKHGSADTAILDLEALEL